MGTTWQATVVADAADADRLRDGIQAALDEVVDEMSTWEADSDISRFNRAPPGTVQVMPAGFFEVLQAATALSADTGGAYDATVGPLVNLWGFGPDGARDAPPSEAEIEQVRLRTGWQKLVLDAPSHSATQPGGLHVDLSSIAKGHGVDRAAATLERAGIRAYLLEVGGELRGRGRKPDGAQWRVAIEHPAPSDGADAPRMSDIVIALDDLAVATSGDYRHFFESGGRRYSHTLDPRTGRPVTHDLASVTVLHEAAMQADGWATALTVLGPEAGWRHALRNDLAALFVSHDGSTFSTRMTPAFMRHLAAP
ncbi:FAD:protein FMN transferase [Marilutibacter penaei]